jgi:hypothetical protein
LVAFGCCILLYITFIYSLLYGPWAKDVLGRNLICDHGGAPTLLLGTSHSFCTGLYDLFSYFLGHRIDEIIFEMAEHDYMRLIDFSLFWLALCLLMAATTVILSWKRIMPHIVRIFIMFENISYFWTSCSMFFWFALTLFMVIGMDPPLMFNVTHFMLFIFAINVIQHTMLDQYKVMGECTELAIWRSQQSYAISTPLYIMAIVQGTAAAWGIAWRGMDKSFWNAMDHGQEVIRAVTVWVTFIWISFVFCLGYTSLMYLHGVPDGVAMNTQLGALFMLTLLAITVWEPLLTVWGFDKSIELAAKDDSQYLSRWIASLLVWWRSKAWIVRYVVDFGMPLVILSGATGGVSLFSVAAYASTMHSYRA